MTYFFLWVASSCIPEICLGFRTSSNIKASRKHLYAASEPAAGKGFGTNKQESVKKKKSSEEDVFQSLLRDLQIQNVPLLECDANSVETYMGATFTTMAELSDNMDASKVCLIFEKIPQTALVAFANDVATLKMTPRLMTYLPELERFHVEVLGNGKYSGMSALVIETTSAQAQLPQLEQQASAEQSLQAMQSFVQRLVVIESMCPHTHDIHRAPEGLRGISPGTVGYRYGGSADALHALASFWTCICELQGSPEISTVVLSLPCIGKEDHDRFATVVEIISRYLCLFRGDALFGLVHFHPLYDRNLIFPPDAPAYGHLPPRNWLRPMMRLNKNDLEAETLTDEQLALSDYQRRSPHTAINILRTNQIAAAAGKNSIVNLELENGDKVRASGITTYSRNAIRLARIGKDALEEALQKEIEMTWQQPA